MEWFANGTVPGNCHDKIGRLPACLHCFQSSQSYWVCALHSNIETQCNYKTANLLHVLYPPPNNKTLETRNSISKIELDSWSEKRIGSRCLFCRSDFIVCLFVLVFCRTWPQSVSRSRLAVEDRKQENHKIWTGCKVAKAREVSILHLHATVNNSRYFPVTLPASGA